MTGLTEVLQLVYQDAFPVAKLGFMNMSLYAYSQLTPGDTNASNTPAVVFTLRATNHEQAPLKLSFLIAGGLGREENS